LLDPTRNNGLPAFLVASGDWGAIYDLAKAAPQQ
jgi:hypothetical protein